MTKAATMTEAQITRRVYRGAGTSTPRGLSDAFTEAQIREIASNPNAGTWRDRAIDLLDALASVDGWSQAYADALADAEAERVDGRMERSGR